MLSKALSLVSGKSITNPAFIGRAAAAAGNFAPGRRIPGAIKFSKGGMVPGVQYLNDGGGVFRSAFQGARQEGFVGQGAFNAARAGGMSSPMAGMGIGMGMQAAGGMMGGQAGTILQVASILPMISMAPITKLISGITGIGTSLKTVGGAAKIFEMILKNAFKVGPILAVTLAITGLVMLFKKYGEILMSKILINRSSRLFELT
jgi:hypothetical protein